MATSYVIRLGLSGPSFTAPADRPLLQSAHAAGLSWPSSCRNGTCRHCIAHLTQGRVTYRIEWPGLLREEKAAGAILACVAYPDSDLILRSVGDPEAHANPQGDQSLPVG